MVVIILLALLMSWTPVAEKAAAAVGTTTANFINIARTVLFVTIGLYLITSGVGALAVAPWLGVGLIVAGVALVTIGIAPFFRRRTVE